MRGSLVRSMSKRKCIGLVCIVALMGLCWAFYVGANHWRIERAIARFEAAPSQAGADILVELIDNHTLTARQGERILDLLLTPKVTTREAYPLGQRPTIGLELPFAVPFRNVSIARREQLLCDGKLLHSSEGSGDDVIRGIPRLRTLHPAPQQVGTYHMEIQKRCTLNLHHHERTWSWHPLSGPFPRCLLPYGNTTTMEFRSLDRWDYACSIAVHADIVIVEKSQAERIELISNPTLDQAMRAAFRSTSFSLTGRHTSPSGKPKSAGGLDIIFQDIPATVGFKAVLHLSDGREIPSDGLASHRLYARAGSSGQFAVFPWWFMLDEPGSYTGSIKLRPNPDIAFEDPAIKTIWNGTLEFPISFTIAKEPNSP